MRTARTAPGHWFATACLLLVGSALVLAASSAHAQWKWRDGKGQVHASDLPPPRDVPEKDVLQRPTQIVRPASIIGPAASAPGPGTVTASTGNVPTATAPRGDPELEKRRKAAEQEQAAKTRQDDEKLDAQRRENCTRARAHAAALDSGQRIARMNDKGEREILDDRGRAEEMRRAREVIASDCKA